MTNDNSKFFEPRPTGEIASLNPEDPPYVVSRIGSALCNDPDCQRDFHGLVIEFIHPLSQQQVNCYIDPDDMDMFAQVSRKTGWKG